jgi:hypothetical protein
MDCAEVVDEHDIKWPDIYVYEETEGSGTIRNLQLNSKAEIKNFIEKFSSKNNVNFNFQRSAKRQFYTSYYYRCHHGTALLTGKRITDTK